MTDPDLTARVQASFDRQGAMATLGAMLGHVARGRVSILMAHRPALTQQHGFVHAGMIATALDSACGYAAFTTMPLDAAVLTIEFKINLLSPAKGPNFRFDGEVTKAGRTISVVDGKAFQLGEAFAADKLIATMTATVMTIAGRDGLHH